MLFYALIIFVLIGAYLFSVLLAPLFLAFSEMLLVFKAVNLVFLTYFFTVFAKIPSIIGAFSLFIFKPILNISFSVQRIICLSIRPFSLSIFGKVLFFAL